MDIHLRTLTTPDGPMKVYEAIPKERCSRAVIVLPEAFGVNDHIEHVARRIADEGYHALALDVYHRSGGGSIPYDAFRQIRPLLEGLTDGGVLDDIDVAIGHLAEAGIGARRIGLVGFCIGGRMTYLAALDRSLGAAVSFYAAGIVTPVPITPQFPSLQGRARSLATPWLGFFGDQDELISCDDVDALAAELSAHAALPHDVVRYPDAGHGFHCDARPESYRADAALDAWHRMVEWLDRFLQ
jgi:carboxymethylenebutenolidase